MPALNHTKTWENLKEAFAGESQANRRYLYFAQKADVEGHNDVAAVFRSTAEGETGHGHGQDRAPGRFRRNRRLVRDLGESREEPCRPLPEGARYPRLMTSG